MRLVTALVLVGLAAGWVGLRAQEPAPPPPEPPVPFPGMEGGLPEDEPETPAATSDASTAEFKSALDLQRKGKWLAAQKALRKVLDQYPESVHKKDIEDRSGDNALLGCDALHLSGPPARRIDVTVMGDGFTIDSQDQNLEEKWAKLCLEVLWSEECFEEYKDYFNYYFVRLASLEEGVDPNLSEEEKAKIIERNKTRTRKKKVDFSTALDCKAAGPQGQVMADRRLVFKWLKAAAREVAGCDDDGLVIAFARFGVLGMGGGGIANVGRPDKSVTVHEFGHSFVGLLDEYAINPMLPREEIRAANAATTSDPEKVPWAHFLKKKVPGVGIFEGGATFKKGVWRPAQGCTMNSAGNTKFCPVCREAAVLRVYAVVNPIDAFTPSTTQELEVTEGAPDVLSVIPMQPRKHALDVIWHVESLAGAPPEPEAAPPRETGEPGATGDPGGRRWDRFREAFYGRWGGGSRGHEERTAYDQPPPGPASTLGTVKKGDRKHPTEHQFPVGRLKPGRYRITAQVKDPTAWVLLDPKHLLEQRQAWRVTVLARK